MKLKRHRLLFLALLLTGCAGLIGVPDLEFDANAPQGRDGGGTGVEGGSSGGTSGGTSSGGTSGGTSSGNIDDGGPIACDADLQTSKEHCGACGVDCLHGDCKEGICTLTPTLYGTESLTIADDDVYIGLTGDVEPHGVVRCGRNGCNSPTVGVKRISTEDASAGIQPYKVVANATHVFATDYYGANRGGVWRMDRAGGGFVKLPASVDQDRSYGLAIDATTLYWAEEKSTTGGIWACDLPDCPNPTKIAEADDPSLVRVGADGRVVFTHDQGVRIKTCSSKAVCGSAPEVPTLAGYIRAMVLDGNTVYWTQSTKILSCVVAPTICSNPTTVHEGIDRPFALTMREGRLYWAALPFDAGTNEFDNPNGSIYSCLPGSCSGAGVRTIATKQRAPADITTDTRAVYWANGTVQDEFGHPGEVRKAPR